ncbi:MAG: hypothetical protein QXN96_00335 [Candidatus Bathyarchaeia archaeon]
MCGFSYAIVFVGRYELEEFVGEVNFEDRASAIAVRRAFKNRGNK